MDRLLTRAAQKHVCANRLRENRILVNRAATVRERFRRPWLRKAVGRKFLIPGATVRERKG